MARQVIGLGTTANDGTGDSLRDGGDKINDNFVELYDAIPLSVPTSDGTSFGPYTSAFNSGYSSSAIGDLVYLDSSGTWQKADMDTSAATYSGLLGIALEVKASGNALKVALPGSFVYCTAFPALTIGSPVYMSDAGALTQTAPSGTDDATRVIGWAVHADKIYFYPSQDYITHV